MSKHVAPEPGSSLDPGLPAVRLQVCHDMPGQSAILHCCLQKNQSKYSLSVSQHRLLRVRWKQYCLRAVPVVSYLPYSSSFVDSQPTTETRPYTCPALRLLPSSGPATVQRTVSQPGWLQACCEDEHKQQQVALSPRDSLAHTSSTCLGAPCGKCAVLRGHLT